MYLNRDYRGNENQSDDKTETIDSNIFSGICGSIESGRKVSRSNSNVQKSTERSEIRLIMKTTHFWLAKMGILLRRERILNDSLARTDNRAGENAQGTDFCWCYELFLTFETVQPSWCEELSNKSGGHVMYFCLQLINPVFVDFFFLNEIFYYNSKNNTNYRHGFCGVFFTVLFPSYQR